MPIFIDQMLREVEINTKPQRIISLVPSQTELLFDLGLDNEVIGITKFCIHPKHWLKEKNIVGGTKKLNLKKIEALKPDLIIGNKEENSKEDIEILMQKFPVWMSDINNLAQALQMIESIATITHKTQHGMLLNNKIKEEFNHLQDPIHTKKRVAYFIWNEPLMVVGENTFINNLLEKIGLVNVFAADIKSKQISYRYPQITAAELQAASPDIIYLSSEPFPFKDKHVQLFKSICPHTQIKIVDGEMFSWYGSRLAKAPTYFKTLIA